MKREIATPSRSEYERNHPTVSFRITPEMSARLNEIKKAEGKSYAEIMKIGLGLLEVKTAKEMQIRIQGYGEGYKEGYGAAKSRYRVCYPCRLCGKTISVTGIKEKEAIEKLMPAAGWGHEKCIKREK